MKKSKQYPVKLLINLFLTSVLLHSSCNSDDPEPVNEEELITTVTVVLTPTEGSAVNLTFTDLDGDGPGEPVITPALAILQPETIYTASISFLNESGSTPEDITVEIEEEKNDHLICFSPSAENITVSYNDEDTNGHAIGLATTWTTGAVGEAGTITIILRHQPGSKTGECPGTGDTDVEVSFPIQVGVN